MIKRHYRTGLSGRLIIFLSMIAALICVMLSRLVDLQLIRGTVFANYADANRFFTVIKPAERGVIFDRYQQPLVFNKPAYLKIKDLNVLYSETERVDLATALQLQASDSSQVQYTLERTYRFPESLSHLLGYTGKVTAEDLLKESKLHPQDVIGKYGLERQFEQYLKGRSGSEVYEINALGKRQRLLREEQGLAGQSLTTSIDPYLTEIAYRALGSNKGSIVILDAENSEVLTLISTPTFNANIMSSTEVDFQKEQERRNVVNNYFKDSNNLFFNKAISGTYPPGSVFKLITALAGLEAQAFDGSTTVIDEGVLKVGDYSYANWYFTQYGGTEGEISLQRAISRSNDIFFYKAAEWVGPSKLAEMAEMLGLGTPTGIDLRGEAKGLVPSPKWKEEIVGDRWYLGNTYHFGIGQADLLVTPLQVAHYTQALANRGTMCTPQVVTSIGDENGERKQCQEVGLHEDNVKLVLRGMIDACSPGGTAFPFFTHNATHLVADETDPYKQLEAGAVACKTGTAEFGGVDEQGFRKTHGWFTAIVNTQYFTASNAATLTSTDTASSAVVLDADNSLHVKWIESIKENPFPKKIVIVAMVESEEGQPYREGSRDAAPIVKAILDWMKGV